MSKFKFNETGIEGLYVVEPTVFGDGRGYFMETFNGEFEPYVKHLDGSPARFVQDNESMSKKGVLRGLHFQRKNPQGKLVRCLAGEVFDVAVDLRGDSETYGKWYGVTLSGENRKMFYVPEGFAHGFSVISDTAVFSYKCTRYYDPEDEGGLFWNDPEIGIKWVMPEGGDGDVILSEKDMKNPALCELEVRF
ncbi:MAG: dTDP-4-dehydrorhamnose 3,5-epimerase [Ruminococcus sp.]|nr:dTDP-4-dehydrorhamnose 3,5-epimerase [Ruminococcus sp.]